MEPGSEKLRTFLLSLINTKQILILSEISKKSGETSTALLSRISRQNSLPLSTLKLNMKKLIALGLVIQENSKPVALTRVGEIVLKFTEENRV